MDFPGAAAQRRHSVRAEKVPAHSGAFIYPKRQVCQRGKDVNFSLPQICQEKDKNKKLEKNG